MSAQQAFDATAALLPKRYKDWHAAIAELSLDYPDLNSDVWRYVEAVKNVVLANLNWGCVSERLLCVPNKC